MPPEATNEQLLEVWSSVLEVIRDELNVSDYFENRRPNL